VTKILEFKAAPLCVLSLEKLSPIWGQAGIRYTQRDLQNGLTLFEFEKQMRINICSMIKND